MINEAPFPHRPDNELAEDQFKIIVNGLQIEHAGKPHSLINVCVDSRFISAKKNLKRVIGEVRMNELLNVLFKQ